MNQKPLYILNTTEDILYPLDQIIPAVDFLKRDNPHIVFRTPKGNHFLSYLPEEQTSLVTFIKENTRKPLTHIVWETANISKINSIGWLRLSALSLDQAPASWHVPYPKVRIENNKADLGLKYDYTYQGKGLKVAGFKNDTVTAKRLGVKQGDILLSLERDSITSPMSPMLYMAKKKAGDPTQISVLREGTPLTLKGNFNAGYPYLLLKQPEKTAKIEAELIGRRVYMRTSRVADYQIDRVQAPVKIKGKIKNLNK
jgi:phospholipase/carboxylesterase family protein